MIGYTAGAVKSKKVRQGTMGVSPEIGAVHFSVGGAMPPAFNILNHPNFGNPINYMTSPQFGQSTQMFKASVLASIVA